MIGWKNSRHFLNQSEIEAYPIVIRSHSFSRALCQLHVITSGYDWFNGLSEPSVAGDSYYLGFGLKNRFT